MFKSNCYGNKGGDLAYERVFALLEYLVNLQTLGCAVTPPGDHRGRNRSV